MNWYVTHLVISKMHFNAVLKTITVLIIIDSLVLLFIESLSSDVAVEFFPLDSAGVISVDALEEWVHIFSFN